MARKHFIYASFNCYCFQILLADLRELRGVLDNLIWKGSELSASMRLKDLDVKDTLKQLEEKWSQAVQDAEKKLLDLDDLRMDWAEKEEMLANMESWVVQAEDQLENERGLSSRDEDNLREALAYYEVKIVSSLAIISAIKMLSPTCMQLKA